jgi:hypothetical protein
MQHIRHPVVLREIAFLCSTVGGGGCTGGGISLKVPHAVVQNTLSTTWYNKKMNNQLPNKNAKFVSVKPFNDELK